MEQGYQNNPEAQKTELPPLLAAIKLAYDAKQKLMLEIAGTHDLNSTDYIKFYSELISIGIRENIEGFDKASLKMRYEKAKENPALLNHLRSAIILHLMVDVLVDLRDQPGHLSDYLFLLKKGNRDPKTEFDFYPHLSEPIRQRAIDIERNREKMRRILIEGKSPIDVALNTENETFDVSYNAEDCYSSLKELGIEDLKKAVIESGFFTL